MKTVHDAPPVIGGATAGKQGPKSPVCQWLSVYGAKQSPYNSETEQQRSVPDWVDIEVAVRSWSSSNGVPTCFTSFRSDDYDFPAQGRRVSDAQGRDLPVMFLHKRHSESGRIIPIVTPSALTATVLKSQAESQACKESCQDPNRHVT